MNEDDLFMTQSIYANVHFSLMQQRSIFLGFTSKSQTSCCQKNWMFSSKSFFFNVRCLYFEGRAFSVLYSGCFICILFFLSVWIKREGSFANLLLWYFRMLIELIQHVFLLWKCWLTCGSFGQSDVLWSPF